MTYDVVFDVSSSPTVGLSPIIWAGPAVALAALILRGLWLRRHDPDRLRSMPYGLVACFVIFTLIAVATIYYRKTQLMDAVLQGRATTVEGTVTDFKPMPYSGHSMEHFCVQGHCFDYSDFVLTPGFNNTSSHGGPIREGLPVRVTFIDNAIVKLEVAAR